MLLPSELLTLFQNAKHKNSYTRTLKAYHSDTYQYLKSLPLTFPENAFNYMHQVEPVRCEICDKTARFINTVQGYSNTCGNQVCARTWNFLHSKKYQVQQTMAITPAPECSLPTCTNTVTTKTRGGVWKDHCSTACRGQHNSLKSREKASATMMQNHGVKHALQSTAISTKMRDGLERKYGVRQIMDVPEFREKIVDRNMEKYGFPNWMTDPDNYKAHCDLIFEKYGVTNISQIPGVQAKKDAGKLRKKLVELNGESIFAQGYEPDFLDMMPLYVIESLTKAYNGVPYEFDGVSRRYFPDFDSENITYEVKSSYTFERERDKNLEKFAGVIASGKDLLCAIIEPSSDIQNLCLIDKHVVKLQTELATLTTVTQIQQIQKNIFVDLFLPEHNIAIKYLSNSFHNSDLWSKENAKTLADVCNQQNIRLIVLNSSNISHTKQVVSMIMSKVQKPTTIYARQCEVVKLRARDCRNFLRQHHLQGFRSGEAYYGLTHQDKLVAVCVFAKPSIVSGSKSPVKNSKELIRYATSETVVGGCSKLIARYVRDFAPTILYSFSDNQYSTGDMYAKIGFELESETKIGYSYVKPMTDNPAEHRTLFQKAKLPTKLAEYIPGLTEKELTHLNGYRQLFDLGKKKWVLKFNDML